MLEQQQQTWRAWLQEYLKVGSPGWAVRRRLTIAIVLVAFFVILFQAVYGTDTPRVLGLTGQMVDLIKWTATVYLTAATAETAVQTVRNAAAPSAPPPAPPGPGAGAE